MTEVITPEQIGLINDVKPNCQVNEKKQKTISTLRELDEQLLRTVIITPKMIQILGDERLLPRKARLFFGEDDGLYPIARRRKKAQEKHFAQDLRRKQAEKQKTISVVLKKKPTVEQMTLGNMNHQHISPKALRLLGDDFLNEQSLRVITPEMRKNVNSKTLNVFGEPAAMLTSKQQQLLGVNDCRRSKSSSWWVGALKEKLHWFHVAHLL